MGAEGLCLLNPPWFRRVCHTILTSRYLNLLGAVMKKITGAKYRYHKF